MSSNRNENAVTAKEAELALQRALEESLKALNKGSDHEDSDEDSDEALAKALQMSMKEKDSESEGSAEYYDEKINPDPFSYIQEWLTYTYDEADEQSVYEESEDFPLIKYVQKIKLAFADCQKAFTNIGFKLKNILPASANTVLKKHQHAQKVMLIALMRVEDKRSAKFLAAMEAMQNYCKVFANVQGLHLTPMEVEQLAIIPELTSGLANLNQSATTKPAIEKDESSFKKPLDPAEAVNRNLEAWLEYTAQIASSATPSLSLLIDLMLMDKPEDEAITTAPYDENTRFLSDLPLDKVLLSNAGQIKKMYESLLACLDGFYDPTAAVSIILASYEYQPKNFSFFVAVAEKVNHLLKQRKINDQLIHPDHRKLLQNFLDVVEAVKAAYTLPIIKVELDPTISEQVTSLPEEADDEKRDRQVPSSPVSDSMAAIFGQMSPAARERHKTMAVRAEQVLRQQPNEKDSSNVSHWAQGGPGSSGG